MWKKLGNRILSFVLMLAMVVCMLPGTAGSVQAADVQEGTPHLTLTVKQTGVFTVQCQELDTVYSSYNQEYEISPQTDTAGVYLNGEKTTKGMIRYPSYGMYLDATSIKGKESYEAGDVVQIYGTWAANDASGNTHLFDFDSSFKYCGKGQWVYLSKLTLGDSSNANEIYLTGCSEFGNGKDDFNAWTESDVAGVFYNGKWMARTEEGYAGAGPLYYLKTGAFYIYLPSYGITNLQIGDEILVKGAVALNEYSVDIGENYLVYIGDGKWQLTYESLKTVAIDTDWRNTQKDDGTPNCKTGFYFMTSSCDELSDTNWAAYKFCAGGFLVNGLPVVGDYVCVKKVVSNVGNSGRDLYYAAFDGTTYGINGFQDGDLVTVSGDISNDSGYKVRFLQQSFKYSATDGWRTYATVTNGELALCADRTNSAFEINLVTDCNVLPAKGFENSYGWEHFLTEYDGGIWWNDQKLVNESHYLLKNYESGYMNLYIRWDMIQGTGYTGPKKGDKLKIQGVYCDSFSGAKHVQYEAITFWWNGSNWTTKEVISGGNGSNKILADNNGDDNLNSMDVVRMKRYLCDAEKLPSIVLVNEYNADANKDGVINYKDLIKTYEYILEGSVVDGVYVQGDVPVYLDDVEIPMFAFQGPRAGGTTDYNYTPSETTVFERSGNGLLSNPYQVSGSFTTQAVTKSYLNATEMKKYKDAGFTRLLPEGDCPWTNHKWFTMGGGMYANMKYYMLLAKEAGLDVVVTVETLNHFFDNAASATEGSEVTKTLGDGTTQKTTINNEIIREDLQDLVTFMNGENDLSVYGLDEKWIEENYPKAYWEGMKSKVTFDNFAGIQMGDELFEKASGETQKENLLTKYQFVAETLRARKADAVFVGSQTAETLTDATTYTTAGKTIKEIVAESTGSFLYNFYPFAYDIKNKTTRNGKNVNATDWFANLQHAAENVGKNGYQTAITIQSFAMDNSASNKALKPIESQEEMNWQVYTALAYGMKELNYFTYWEHRTQANVSGEAHYASMVEYPSNPNADGAESVTTDTYNYVQAANQAIKKFDHVFMDFTWQNAVKKDAEARNVTIGSASFNVAGSGSVVVSEMKDKNKQKNNLGYWVVNATTPTDKKKTDVVEEVTLSFKGASYVMTWEEGNAHLTPITDGTYKVSLGVGEGTFVVPVTVTK